MLTIWGSGRKAVQEFGLWGCYERVRGEWVKMGSAERKADAELWVQGKSVSLLTI